MNVTIVVDTDRLTPAERGALSVLLTGTSASLRDSITPPAAPSVRLAPTGEPPAEPVTGRASNVVDLVPTTVVAEPVAGGPSLDDLKGLLTKVMGHPKAGGPRAVAEAFKRFGCERLTNGPGSLDPSRYADFAADIKSLLDIADAA